MFRVLSWSVFAAMLACCAFGARWAHREAFRPGGWLAGPLRLQGILYSGKPMRLGRDSPSVVIDLRGLRVDREPRPVLFCHDNETVVGHTAWLASTGNELLGELILSGTGPVATDCVRAALRGYPWQVSLGLDVVRDQSLKEDESVSVNGSLVKGPARVIWESILDEVSLVPIPADTGSEVRIAES